MDKIISFSNEYATFFGIISSIATAIAVLIGLYTIFEVKKQRESSYKPELILEEKRFFVDKREMPYIHYYPNTINTEDVNRTEIEEVLNFNLKCVNVGLATAKNVIIEFKIDLDHYTETIEKFNAKRPEQKTKYDFKYFGKSGDVAIVRNDKIDDSRSLFGKIKQVYKMNYVLPVNIDNTPVNIPIPNYFIYLSSIMQQYSWSETNNDNHTGLVFYTSLEYRDIGNKKHKQYYKVKFQPEYVTEHFTEMKIIITT